eukprot:276936-Pleurochrysis_carterae.AAC.3
MQKPRTRRLSRCDDCLRCCVRLCECRRPRHARQGDARARTGRAAFPAQLAAQLLTNYLLLAAVRARSPASTVAYIRTIFHALLCAV